MASYEFPSGRHRQYSESAVDAGVPPSATGRDLERDADATTEVIPGRSTAASGSPAKRRRPFWIEIPVLVAATLVVAFVVQSFVVRTYVVPSGSMESTLHGCPGCANDRVAVDRLTVRFHPPAPGDVVVLRGNEAWAGDADTSGGPANPLVRAAYSALAWLSSSSPDEKDFVKRVIATGGQTVACCDSENRVTVDGRPLSEPYVHFQSGVPAVQAPFDPVRLGPDQLWVMGDNRNNSADSRAHGPILRSDVIGKVQVVLLPVSRWRTVPDTNPQIAGAGH